MNGELDVAAVFGPFAGWVKTMKDEPLTILPVNLEDDKVPLEFELAIGVRKTDAFLKYMLEFALEDHAEEVEKILKDYGVPLVQCSKCIVAGDLPAHGSYIALADQKFEARPDLASPDQVVTKEKLERWLAEGADLNQELSNAVIANDFDRVKFLVEKGADVNKPDPQGWTPLQNAARQRKDEMIKTLIELGADVNRPDDSGMTPLVAAAMRDHVPSIKVLLENGADIEQAGPAGLPAAGARHRRRQIRGGQGADGGRRRCQRRLRRRRPDAADADRGANLAGRGRALPARQHAPERHRQRPGRARRRCQCPGEERHDRADDRGDA